MSEQVLVTGISGFIAKHVARRLLADGHRVRGTVRDAGRADEVRAALAADGTDVSGLSFAEADLLSDDGWTEAARGCTCVQHLASPFPMKQPRHREALVPEARQGALRVLEAARDAGAERLVLTSSMVAMMYREEHEGRVVIGETDWTDPSWTRLSAYVVSKTRAEKAAWDRAREIGWEDRLTVVNPGLVLGPALDGRTGTSLDIIKLLMTGAYPVVPPAAYPIVDVRDVAEVHARAMAVPGTCGRRLIAAGETLSMPEMGRLLKGFFPAYARKIPTRALPPFLVHILAVFDGNLKTVIPDLGVEPVADQGYVTELTGVEFRGAAEAVRAAGQSLIDHGIV